MSVLKKSTVAVFTAVLLILSLLIFSACGEPLPQGKYVCEEPYLSLNIPDAENIIDFDGEMSLNGETCDIVFTINKDTRHYEIKRGDETVFDGYFSTQDNGETLYLKSNEAEFTLKRE